jgi:hypothetical protein
VDPKLIHFASKDKEKIPKVVILTWCGIPETRYEFIHADRQLAEFLGMHISRLAAEANEHVGFVTPRKVEEFKNSNPNWRGMDLCEIGRRLGADHVILLELAAISLYERGSSTLMRGRINLNIQLADVHKPDDAPRQEMFSCEYPSEAPGPLEATNEQSKMQFRQAFLHHVARKLSYYFSRYPLSERRRMD